MNDKCYRIGSQGKGKLYGVRDRSGQVLLFCSGCWNDLIRSNVIDRDTGEVLTA
jgi:hypothetical protein